MHSNRLGLHWIRSHPDNVRDFEFIRRVRPASVKLFEWMWSDADFCRELLAALPEECIILARDHPLSEQKAEMWKDPEGTGQRHADEWAAKVRSGAYHLPTERSYCLGVNEPDATNGDRAAIDTYTVAFLRQLRSHGLKGGAFNFSTGHPRTVDGTPHTPPDYSVFERSHQEIVRGGHIAVAHIYGSADEPCVAGHFDRLTACPWPDVTWVIGECGIDQHVATGGEHHGYLIALHPPTAYPQWLERLIAGTNDLRIHSWMPFTYDFSHPWGAFDVRQVSDAFVAWNWQGLELAPEPEHPTEIYLPVAENGGRVSQPEPTPVPDLFERAMEFLARWEGGYQANPEDHGNWTGGKKGVGELKGTKFGISAASYPHLDIANLTFDEAKAIYRRDYWERSGAHTLPWPACLLVFDTAVLHGVGTAQAWVEEVGVSPFALAAKRLTRYTELDNWHFFGAGWVRRTAELLKAVEEA